MEAGIGIIGGSGIEKIDGLNHLKRIKVGTPFGKPSADYTVGLLGGKRVAFLPRHGDGHTIMPSEINYRANIYGFKKLGVSRVISVSAVGSMKDELKPGQIVLVRQFYDNTKNRISSFFGSGLVAHVSMAEPVCGKLVDIIRASGKKIGINLPLAGTYLCIEGPQFSTRGESNVYRKWGVDVIGMTNMPEAKLAREAELCYATMAMITDYDCWHEDDESVTVGMVIKRLGEMAGTVKKVIKEVVSSMPESAECPCRDMMSNTLISEVSRASGKKKKELELIIGKYL